MANNHQAQQAEYRRLKAEKKARIEREDRERREKKRFLDRQKALFISHDELVELLGPRLDTDGLTILNINPLEGGWKITMIDNLNGK